MPELPEVETIVRHLRKEILGRRIVDFKSDTPRIFRDHRSFGEVRKQVIGRKIAALNRFGKNIIFRLSSGKYLVIHLMMTGKLLINPKEESNHDRFSMELSGRTRLVFNDIRKFGRCRIISEGRTSKGWVSVKTPWQPVLKSLRV